MVHGQATGVQRPQDRDHVGRCSRPREAFFHEHLTVVDRRDVLSEEVRDAESNRILEQDPFGSYQAEVGSVPFSRVVIRA